MSVKDQDLAGKVYVVTGANSGIGFEAAKDFAARGAILVLICRNRILAEKALAEIKRTTGSDNCRICIADFSSLSSVSEMSKQLLIDFPKIDVLCNNAGGANAKRTVTSEGFETTFVTNHLSSFLLSKRLLPALIKAAEETGPSDKARVVFTSSLGHTNSAIDFTDLNLLNGYSTLKAYGRSKLMNLLTARHLQSLLADKHIITSSFHPGTVRTPIWGKGGFLARLLGFFMYPFMISIEKGTDTFIWLASSKEPASINAAGNYFYKRRQHKVADFATDEAANKLWQVSEELIAPYF